MDKHLFIKQDPPCTNNNTICPNITLCKNQNVLCEKFYKYTLYGPGSKKSKGSFSIAPRSYWYNKLYNEQDE